MDYQLWTMDLRIAHSAMCRRINAGVLPQNLCRLPGGMGLSGGKTTNNKMNMLANMFAITNWSHHTACDM